MKWLLLPLLLAVGTWVFFLSDHAPGTDAARRGFPLDDAWIHLVYARSLAEEGGFNYNPGEPETGMTSPLWVVLLAGVLAVAGPGNTGAVVLGAKLLSLFFGLAAIVLLFLVARELGERTSTGLLAACLLAADPAVSFARASGMEVPLFTALLLLALWLSIRGQVVLAGAAAGLSIVARPEGVVLVPLYAWALLRATRGRARPPATKLIIAAALTALPALAYAAFCLHATGRPLPNTYYAKFAPRNPLDPALLWFGWRNYVHDNLPWFTLESGTLLSLLGIWRWIRLDRPRSAMIFGAGFLLFGSAIASRRFVPGHFFYWERWLIPSFPFLHLAIAAGVEEIRTGFSGTRRRAREGKSKIGWSVAAALATLLLVVGLPASLRERADQFAWNAQNIEEMNVSLGRWVNENLPQDAVIAVNDAGALRYFGRRTTIDIMGLNNHRVMHHDPPLGDRLVETFGIGYLVIFPEVFRDMVENLPLTPIREAVARHYTICDGPQDVMVVFRLAGSP